MIRLTRDLPEINALSAEYVRMKCLFDAYSNDGSALFWEQENGRAFFSLADGDMTIYNPQGDTEEMRSFLSMISPKTVFSDSRTLTALHLKPCQNSSVMYRKSDLTGETKGDSLNSKEIYEIFRTAGFSLPEYPHFAVDYCRRLNHGGAAYFGLKNRCAAVTVFSGNAALLTGIASLEKGYGTLALRGILQKNHGRFVLACCREEMMGFYIKNGFRKLYDAGSWQNEHS